MAILLAYLLFILAALFLYALIWSFIRPTPSDRFGMRWRRPRLKRLAMFTSGALLGFVGLIILSADGGTP